MEDGVLTVFFFIHRYCDTAGVYHYLLSLCKSGLDGSKTAFYMQLGPLFCIFLRQGEHVDSRVLLELHIVRGLAHVVNLAATVLNVFATVT